MNKVVYTKSGTPYRPSHLKRIQMPGVGTGNNPNGHPKPIHFQGVKNGRARLTENEVKKIRALHAQGHSFVYLGIQFKVSPVQIRRIIIRENWKHI